MVLKTNFENNTIQIRHHSLSSVYTLKKHKILLRNIYKFIKPLGKNKNLIIS